MATFLWWCHVKTTQQSIVSCGTHYSRETCTKQPFQVHGTLSPRCKQHVISGSGCLAGIALLHRMHEAIMTVGKKHVTNGQDYVKIMMLLVTHIYSMLGNQVRRLQVVDTIYLEHDKHETVKTSKTYKAIQTRALEKESTNMIMMTCNVKPRGCYILSIWFCNCKEWRLRSCERYFQQTEHPSWQRSIHSEGSISILCPMCKQKEPCCNPKCGVCACVCVCEDWILLIVPVTWTADKQLITED